MSATSAREAQLDVSLLFWTGSLFPAYAAARVCYSKTGITGIKPLATEQEMGEWLRDHVLARGHWAIIEQLDFQFAIRGISRACSHQLVRHRIASFAQQSQRYVSKAGFRYITPESIAAVPAAQELYQQTMDELAERYGQLQELLLQANPEARAETINEDARFVLPNACETEIIMKVNGRELLEMARLRLCSRAQWEIRAMFTQIRTLAQQAAPVIFDNMGPDCAWSGCHEGGCALASQYKKRAGW